MNQMLRILYGHCTTYYASQKREKAYKFYVSFRDNLDPSAAKTLDRLIDLQMDAAAEETEWGFQEGFYAAVMLLAPMIQ